MGNNITIPILAEKELTLADLFILIGEAFPVDQELFTFPHNILVKDAIQTMIENNYTQVPVMIGSNVIGIFSFRSFSENALKHQRQDIFSLPVEDFLEDLTYVSIEEELLPLLNEFDLKDAILIGSKKQLQGIITSIDVIELFKKLSLPYIMLREIELTIRNLIQESINKTQLEECAKRVLNHYPSDKLPKCLEDMSLNDKIQIISFGDYWEHFETCFGPNRQTMSSTLRAIPDIRNDVFHFRKELTDLDFNKIKNARDWMLKKYERYMALKETKV